MTHEKEDDFGVFCLAGPGVRSRGFGNAIVLFGMLALGALPGCVRPATIPAVVATPNVLPAAWQAAGVSAVDATDILRQVLELAVLKQRIGDLNLLSDRTRIPILDENAAPLPLPRFSGVEFYYITSTEMVRLAEAEPDGLFMVFRVWKVHRTENDLVVTLANFPRQAERSRRPLLVGSDLTVTFTRTAEGWRAVSERMTIA